MSREIPEPIGPLIESQQPEVAAHIKAYLTPDQVSGKHAIAIERIERANRDLSRFIKQNLSANEQAYLNSLPESTRDTIHDHLSKAFAELKAAQSLLKPK